ncbi:MAG: CvpA family protein [Candidatus Omnitrophica bacterium]|nr:CvpA family protein [Candidatus Omnitrophota bacterium]
MAITDFITFFLSLFLLSRGASRGFVQSLLGPFSIIVATIISIIYYQSTKNMIVSLAIGLIGPLLLHLLLKFLLKTWTDITNTDIKPTVLSRLAGSILTLIWGWVFIILSLILLSVIPPAGKTLTAVHNDVLQSASYILSKPFEDVLFAPLKNSPSVNTSSPTPDTKTLAEDPRFQKILQDPEIQKEIEDHDLVKLMRNPKMMELTQQIMSDPATMKKVMAVYKSQAQQKTAN